MPTVPEAIFRDFGAEEPLGGPSKRPVTTVRLARQASIARPQACQACQQRKRKCDRVQPQCGNCARRGIECTFELKITDRSHPNYLTNLLASLEDKDRRISALESVIRARLPELAHIAALATDAIPPAPGSAAPDTRPSSPAPADDEPLPADLSEPIISALETLAVSRRHFPVPPLVGFIKSSLGPEAEWENDDAAAVSQTAVAQWPPYELAVVLVHEFLRSNAVYPFIREFDLLHDLQLVYKGEGRPDAAATPLQTARLFLVFAVGSVWLSQRGSGDRIDTTLLRNRAAAALPEVIRTASGVDCVSALLLMALTALYDWGGVDLVRLTPMISKLALAVGLHRDPAARHTQQEKDRRRVLFWCVYSLDRIVGSSLSLPIVLSDADIGTALPEHLDELGTLAEGMDATAFFAHMIEMRRLSWRVYEHTRAPSAAEASAIHRALDDWLSRAPRAAGSTPSEASGASSGGSGGGNNTLFDLYYHIFLTRLYGPSGYAEPGDAALLCLRESASAAIAISVHMQKHRLIRDNYFQFHIVIAVGMALLYTLSQYGRGEYAHDTEWCAAAIDEIRTTEAFIGSFCRGWPYARGLSRAFNALGARCIAQLGAKPSPPPPRRDAATELVSTLPRFDFFPFSSADDSATWSAWGAENFLPLAHDLTPGSGDSTANLDDLLALVGWSTDWIPYANGEAANGE
ncbi:hypothetical protein Q8F55_007285 [Vanrija albida]|uniref:Zn(2)-C6 fungal-type domain-containing protein n=1 Tax=Vanrija albida TaxID=181172 RepID=A0ABR3PZH8_9TREE